MFVTYDAESYFKNFLWIGKEEAAIQICDTIPVPEMIKEEDVDQGILVNWQQVDVVSGPSVEEFNGW